MRYVKHIFEGAALSRPASLDGSPARVRGKAIEIANALLAEGCDEGRAIRIAISHAKRWGVTHAVGDTRLRVRGRYS